MQLRYQQNVVPAQDGAAKVAALCFSPNAQKLAVCGADRVISMYDANWERKDKFATKPVDAKWGKKSYVVKGMAFSPDSTKLAIGQTDAILFVYKIGESWGEKKVICNKFAQPSPCTCVIWPSDLGIVVGTLDGKLRLCNAKSNKSSTLYSTGIFVIALAASPNRRSFASAHADRSIVVYSFDTQTQHRLCQHSSPAYALAWAESSVIAAGCDKRVMSYGVQDGRLLQQFDYSRDEHESAFNVAVCSPSGQAVVLGSYDRLRMLNWNVRRGAWDEGPLKEIKYMYTVSTLAWKPDGSKLAVGTLCGNVELFDCSMKRSMLKKKFESTFVGPSHVNVRNVETNQMVIVKSNMGNEIGNIKVMGNDRYVMAETNETLLLADIETGMASEVPWTFSGNEKFYFDLENVCMIFNAGELTLVEYGTDMVLGSVRTEYMNPHIISVRLNERVRMGEPEVKRIAYLIDAKTIQIDDLLYGRTITQIDHDYKVDWLELNETARKLLFRDKRFRLSLYCLQTESKTNLISYCSFVEWVPRSDVIVAQNRDSLCVWYNSDAPDRLSTFPIKGDVTDLLREDGSTMVMVAEGNQLVPYELDEGLIEFGTAIDDLDFGRAVAYLEQFDMAPDTEAMWKQLAVMAIQHKQLHVAKRAYAALVDMARVQYLDETMKIADQAAQQIGGDGTQYYRVRARLAVMARDFREAERIYLEQNAIEEAIDMYKMLHKWDKAIVLAEARGYVKLEELRLQYYRHLADTGQHERAAEIKETEGEYMPAIDLYLRANLPVRAARVITQNPQLADNQELVQSIAMTLIKAQLFMQAGELFEKTKDFQRALKCYEEGKSFNKAVELARMAFPEEVIRLEEAWGDHLVGEKQVDAAINHYIEAGKSLKALEAAVSARQWVKAANIVEVVDDIEEARQYFGSIAEHYASINELERAEQFYIEAGLHREALEMYNKAGRYQDAIRLSNTYLQTDEAVGVYLAEAETLESQGRYKDAEQLYRIVNKPNKAIAMYKNANRHEDMMRMVKEFHGDHEQETHSHLAKELEEQQRYSEAEQHYIQAGEWKTAANMYRTAEQWEDAYRIAKTYGGESAGTQVAFVWAKHLGGDSAVKLLQKLNLLKDAIQYASDNGAFDFAFELCRLGMKSEQTGVHLKYAAHLEEEGQMEAAEEQYLAAGKPKEAVLMHVHQHDWDNAQRLAEQHCQEMVPEVYMGQARIAFEKSDFVKAESFLLRAQKPEIIVKSYKELGMWSDAMRVCKEYVPALLPKLQDEFDTQQLKSGAKGAASYVAQAKDWEAQKDYDKAVNCYLKVNAPLTNDTALMEQCWTRAGDLAVKFLPEEPAIEFVQQAASQLQSINKHSQAADLLLSVGLMQEAVDTFIDAGEWSKAKKVAVEVQPELEAYVDSRYKEHLKSAGKTDQLVGVDAVGAIESFIEEGNWQKALATAKEKSPALLEKYASIYAGQLSQDEHPLEAVQVFEQYGAPANTQNFNLYKRLIDQVFAVRHTMSGESYTMWASLRNMLLNLVTTIESSSDSFDERYLQTFTAYLQIAHYCACRSALSRAAEKDPRASLLATKISISLLRYCDLIAADKAFYEAGIACKDFGPPYEGMAFVFLNHYLDLAEAIEEQNPDAVDNSVFMNTDIPVEFPLPEQMFLTPEDHEDVKEWVLALSVDQNIDRSLVEDSRGVYEASLVNANGSSSQPCIVTGYPALDSPKQFGTSHVANRDDWNKLLVLNKTLNLNELNDLLKFVGKWTGSVINMAV